MMSEIERNHIETSAGDSTEEQKVFGPQVLEDFYGGSSSSMGRQIFIRCAELMVSSLPERLRRLESAVLAHRFEEVGFLSHQLKGSFNATGSSVLANYCDHLVMAAKKSDLAECYAITGKVILFSPLFLKQLGQFVLDLKNSKQEGF